LWTLSKTTGPVDARQEVSLPYAYDQEATRKNEAKWWSGTYDTYEDFLRAGNAGAVAASRGMEGIGFWRKLSAHPAYDSFWQQQAVDKLLAGRPLTVPGELVWERLERWQNGMLM